MTANDTADETPCDTPPNEYEKCQEFENYQEVKLSVNDCHDIK